MILRAGIVYSIVTVQWPKEAAAINRGELMRIDTDRILVGILALLGTCAISVAVADPPATSPASPAPASSSSVGQSATAAAPASNTPAAAAEKPAASATPDAVQAAEEKRLKAAGYKPEMRNGTKYWCRNETEIGSRMEHKVCGTAAEIKGFTHDGQESLEQAQRRQINPMGH